jgi:TldD protein
MRRLPSFALSCTVVLLSLISLIPVAAFPAGDTPDVVLATMQRELKRAFTALAKTDPAPYFMSYATSDIDATAMLATNGGIIFSTSVGRRQGDVMMHVGSLALDNTHNQNRPSGILSSTLPLNNDSDAIARVLWQMTDREYEQASAAFAKVKTSTAVQADEEDKSPDFSTEAPVTHIDSTEYPAFTGQKMWEERIRKISRLFLKYPEVYTSAVLFTATRDRSYLATSEGTALVRPAAMMRLVIQAETRADDGTELLRVESYQGPTTEQLPGDAELEMKVAKMSADLKALRAAPSADPYAGPAMLSGRAAAVFFHEVLGHRLEGHRQRDENEGQTFTKKVNQLILPAFLSVTDDPTLKELNGTKLAGYYDYDDEGVPAQKVAAVENGVLKNFLMSRMPIKGFDHSNGHGRRQPGLMATGRQGNLIVTSTNMVKDSEVRQKFIEEIKKQGKPYGLYFDDIQGGFTLTQRALPQAFQVLPVMVYRVYADGRPDELVRGVDIVGTPLLSLNNIMVTGDTLQVFNGVCGAESGQVPVSAAAPSMLFSTIEVQKRKRGTDRPPILPPPDAGGAAAKASAQGGKS